MRKWNLFWFCLLIAHNLTAQNVETVASNPKIVDGLHVDETGNIYTTPGGLMGGLTIGKATPVGDYEPNFRNGFNGAIDIDGDGEGLLFVTNYDDNTLKSYDLAMDEVTTLASGLDGPAGLTIDGEGNVFLTCFGAPPSYNGNQIVKVSPNGNSEVWLETSAFFRPQGITFDDDGFLWVANTPTGKIFKIDTMTKIPELILELGAKVGNLVFRQKDQQLYFTSQDNHQIYRMDLQGNLDTLAGAGGVGSTDGAAMTAQFNKPLGLGFTASEDTLYVAESGKLRRITQLDGTTSHGQEIISDVDFKIIPNPNAGSMVVEFPFALKQSPCTLSVFNELGSMVYERQIEIGENAVSIRDLGTGVWYVRLFFENQIIVEKVLVF